MCVKEERIDVNDGRQREQEEKKEDRESAKKMGKGEKEGRMVTKQNQVTAV